MHKVFLVLIGLYTLTNADLHASGAGKMSPQERGKLVGQRMEERDAVASPRFDSQALPAAGASQDSSAPAADADSAGLEPASFQNNQDVQDVVAGFVPDARKLMRASKTIRKAALSNAAREYAKALKDGGHVPDAAMKGLRDIRDDGMFNDDKTEKQYVTQLILDNLRDRNNSIINIPNKIPPFLAGSVTDKTANVHSMIDAIERNPHISEHLKLNPHIAEHMKHSVGYYTNHQK